MSTVERKPFAELKLGDKVQLKGAPWEVVGLDALTERVTVDNGRGDPERTGKMALWPVIVPDLIAPPANPELITVQEYLRAVGMPDDELEGAARTFGTVLMRLYRERHGKDAKPAKKPEYVAYLDRNGLEAQRPNDDAPVHLRVPANGWYMSNAFSDDDIDLLEAVRERRHPGLPRLSVATSRAIEAATDMGLTLDGQPAVNVALGRAAANGQRDVIWLVEEAVKRCLASGVVCGHAICAQRRSKQSRRISPNELEVMDWS